MKAAENQETFPLPVTRSGVTVRIYRIAGSSGYSSYQVADYSNGNRKLQSFSDLGKAKAEAKRIAAALARGDSVAASLRGPDAASYARAIELLKPTGVSIEVAAAAFAGAYKDLGGDRILEAAKYYAKRHPVSLERKPLADAIDEFLEAKRQDKAKDRYLKDLDYRLGKLRDAFHCDLQGLSGARMELWLRRLELSPQSRLNFRRVFNVFFKWCIQHKWLPKDWDELDNLTRPKVRRSDVTVYTPEEIAKLLTAAPSEFLPVLAIAAFAGVRSAELERLSWMNVDLEQRHIKLSVGDAKTASRRIIPVSDNLSAWLRTCAKDDLLWPFPHDELYDVQQETAAKAGIKWKHNGCRHSFISYRLASVQDAAKVALEAGNSAEMIFEHYRELVTAAEAAVWFAITPENAADVIALRQSLQKSHAASGR